MITTVAIRQITNDNLVSFIYIYKLQKISVNRDCSSPFTNVKP